MRGDGPDGVGRDVEGEVDRALRRPGGAQHGRGERSERSPSERSEGAQHGRGERSERSPSERSEGAQPAAAQNGPRIVSPLEIRAALWDAISAGRGIVVLEVTRRGEPAVRARLSPIVWAALWDSLAPSPVVEDDEEEEAGR